MRDFKFIDLFCGIGGFHQAMSSLGGECVFACDIDKDCRDVYFDNYGIMPESDITKIDERDIPPFNVLCAGFPCQAFSQAGKRLGFADKTRGTLFFDIIRIAKHHRPEYMLLENVKNLALHDGGNTWNTIYHAIRDCGYNVLREPVVFSPHYIGVPQNRERVYIMCVREDVGSVPEFAFDGRIPECSVNDILVDDAEIEHIEKYRVPDNKVDLINLWDDFIKGMKCNLPCSTICAECFGEDIPEHKSWLDVIYEKNRKYYFDNREFIDKWLERSKGVELFKNSRLRLEWQTTRSENESIWNHIMQFRESGLRVKRPDYFPALVAIVQTSIIGPRKRYAIPRECARMQSFPDTFRIPESDSVAYKQFGNSVNVEVVKLFARYMFGDAEIREKYSVKNLF